MRSVADRNVVARRIPVRASPYRQLLAIHLTIPGLLNLLPVVQIISDFIGISVKRYSKTELYRITQSRNVK